MAKAKLVGVPIDTGVADQIKYRAAVFNKQEGRTAEDVAFMNSSTAFVRLMSGINTTTDELEQARRKAESFVYVNSGIYSYENQTETNKKYLAQYNGNNTLATKFILHGGTAGLQDVSTPNSPSAKLLINRSGVSNSSDSDTASYLNYNSETGLGFRPLPGITSMNIVAFNRYGTLRKATVKFNCWSIEQLDSLEKLYMRPGYTMFLEWGHTYYIDENGQKVATQATLVNEFFKAYDQYKFQELIQNKKKTSGFNYDGILGRVVNFSWTYRQDGGYDCTVDLVSQGEMLESVQALLSPDASAISALRTIDGANVPDTLRNYPTTLHLVFTIIANWPTDSVDEINQRLRTVLGDKLDYLKYSNVDIFFSNLYENLEGKNRLKFVRLRNILDIVNGLILPKADTGRSIFEFDVSETVNEYCTFPYHFSGNPSIAVLPTSQIGIPLTNESVALDATLQDKESDKVRDVLDIGVNADFILSVLEGMLEARAKQNDRQFIFDFVKNILDGVNQALGSINDLDLHYDSDTLLWYVIDRNLPINFSSTDKDSTRLNLTGLDSTTTEITLTSQLSSELSSMMAIAASATATDLSPTLEGFYRLNVGYVDRLSPERKPLSSMGVRDGKWKDYSKRLTQIVDCFELYVKETGGAYEPTTFTSLSVIHQEWTNYAYKLFQGTTRTDARKAAYAGIIPFKLQIRIKGISGIKILQCFSINKGILPPRYDETVAFIATGLEHTVENNEWYTLINAQTFIPEDNVIKKQKQELENVTPPTPEETGEVLVDLPQTSNEDLWSLVAICAAENFRDNPQGMADVAQSIYNRLAAGGYGKTIKEIVTAPNQYEPTFKNIGDWKAIKDSKTAAIAYKNSRNVSLATATQVIVIAYNAIQNQSLRAEAGRHIGSRTEFLAYNPKSSQAVAVTVRKPDRKNNNFYWRYRGKDVFYKKNILQAQPTPPGIIT